MNIFLLARSPTTSARAHTDAHVVCMVRELFQMLSTAHHHQPGDIVPPYKTTHVNHPCAIWVRESTTNYEYAYQLAVALSAEYTFRYGKEHGSYTICHDVLRDPPAYVPTGPMTRPRLAMPDEYKLRHHAAADDSVADLACAIRAYRDLYDGGKRHLFKWTRRQPPSWVTGSKERSVHAKRDVFVYRIS